MQNFQEFLNEVKSFESSLWKYLVGTAVLSGVLVAGQFNKFTPGFNALTEVCGVIAGMAAIIPAYMKRLVHASERPDKVLNYVPTFLPSRTVATLLLAILAFYLYYQLAKSGLESCLFLMVAGVYLFFRVMGQSIHHFYMLASQEVIWNELSPQMQKTWMEGQKQAVEFLLRDRNSDPIVIQGQLLDMQRKKWQSDKDKKARTKLRQQGRWGRFLAIIYPLRRPTLKIRTALGLISEKEQEDLEATLKAMKEVLQIEIDRKKNEPPFGESTGGHAS